MSTTILRTVNVSKAYEGVQALREVSFDLRAGEVHAIVGENGAGKSTLIKIITGAVTPDSGHLEFDDVAVKGNSPSIAKQFGVAAIYQQPALFPDLSVIENIVLGLENAKPWTRVDWRRRRARATELLKQTAAHIDPDRSVATLTMPEQQLVEIARALGANARILIMDEPTASLAEAEVQNLYRVIENLRESGVGIIYISHRLDELSVVADRVTVLCDGEVVATRQMQGLSVRELISLMVGRELSAVFPKRSVPLGEVVLELRGLGCNANGVTNIDLTVRAGEIVGLAGLVGAGRTELARTIFGLDPADAGEIRLRDERVKIDSPFEAIRRGIAYLPEDRRRHGVVLDMSISANLTLPSLKKFSKNGALDREKERETAARSVRRLGIKTPAVFSSVSTLSGGNQQKVALGRWLEIEPSLLILDEPTQGIDVGAKAEIHSLMGELAEQGVAILMISSELPEILGMSDRIVVLRQGTIAGALSREAATQEAIMSLAVGHDLPDAA
ncbi:MAG TPA: sugar ABC transporter ATP-binding protein [Pyrinomonadaceae bacterium]|nr:sugar ABC transporter ATP-binding protein [Pyrinomonadaceae bacterium]